jgi:hypothetical protein
VTRASSSLSGVTQSGLTPLEQEVIATILRPAHPVMDGLCKQLELCRVVSREFSGVGFFTTVAGPDDLRVAAPGRLVLGDVQADIPGLLHGAGFLLWVEDGMITMLEGFSYDELWPDRIETYAVSAVHPDGGPTDVEKVQAAFADR